MLDAGCNVNQKDNHGDTALMVASRAGRERSVKVLLTTGMCKVNEINLQCQTALHMAISNGHSNICELLLDAGADPDIKDNLGGITPFILIATMKDIDLGRVLLEKGADVNLAGDNGRTALHYACIGGCEQLVQLLVDSGASVDIPDSFGLLPIHHVASNEDLVTLLIKRGAEVNGQNLIWPTWSPLHFACMRQNTCRKTDESFVRFLLKSGMNYDKRINDRRPIDLAVESNKLGVVFELLFWNCSVREYVGERPLILQAILNENLTLAKLLHVAGANIPGKRLSPWLGQKKCATKYIETVFNEPRTLQSTSRICIRNNIKGKIHRKVSGLPLPRELKNYLLLEDLRPLMQTNIIL